MSHAAVSHEGHPFAAAGDLGDLLLAHSSWYTSARARCRHF